MGLGLRETVVEQQKIEKILLSNAGLDIGYVMGGFYLRERSQNLVVKRPERMRGWGNSLLLQGGFLQGFDIVMVIVHNKHGADGAMKLLETVQVGPGGLGLSLAF